MTDVTLMTAEELNDVLSRVDGDAEMPGFSGFELVILVAHLKQTGQLEFTSPWYTGIFDVLVDDGFLDEDGNILDTMFSLFWKVGTGPLYYRTDKTQD